MTFAIAASNLTHALQVFTFEIEEQLEYRWLSPKMSVFRSKDEVDIHVQEVQDIINGQNLGGNEQVVKIQ